VRVLLVNSSPTMRGGESQTLELGLRLRERGIETAFAVRAGSELADALPEDADSVKARFETPPFITPFRLRRFIILWKPDIVHAQTSKAHTHAIFSCAGLAPLVVSRRTAFGAGAGPVSRLKYGRAVAHYIPISHAAALSLRSRGVPEEKMTIVHSGVDISRFRSSARDPEMIKRLGGGRGSILAGTVAAFEKEKGHGVLLDAAAILKERGARLRYVLAGSGRMEDTIVAGASKRGIDIGIFRTGSDLPLESFLKALDIYVLPSIEEGLSTGLIAAMASGLPCVASRTGGIPEVTGGDAALLFEPGDPEGLADALEKLSIDVTLREGYSARASERAGMFDAGRMADETITVYEKVLGGRRM